MRLVLDGLIDEGSLLEIHARWAKEVIVGYARLDGRVIGIVANQPKVKGGVLFVDSSDKCARFIWTCNAFNIPLLFLADVPGFMIGTQVEREGIIRHGAKMISAVSEANVPKISVIVRKAYGAGLYAMAGPAFDPDCCIALPTASIAVMGPQAAINAVYYNQLQAIEDPEERAARTEQLRREFAEDIDMLHLASELVIDAVIQPEDLRAELIRRFALAAGQAARMAREAQPDHAGVDDLDGTAVALDERVDRVDEHQPELQRAVERLDGRQPRPCRRPDAIAVQDRARRGSRSRSPGVCASRARSAGVAPRPRCGSASSCGSSAAICEHMASQRRRCSAAARAGRR